MHYKPEDTKANNALAFNYLLKMATGMDRARYSRTLPEGILNRILQIEANIDYTDNLHGHFQSEIFDHEVNFHTNHADEIMAKQQK